MATRNIVPRANEEGNIGTSLKNWLKGWFKDLFVSGNLTDGTKSISIVQIDAKEDASNKKTTLADDSDAYYPSQKAVKTAVDAKASVTDIDQSIITSYLLS